MKRTLIAVLAVLALAVGATVASAHKGHDDKGGAKARTFTLKPDPAGNPEGVAFDKRSKAFFVGITADGAIYRGTLGSDTVAPYIPGAAGKSAVGLKVKRGKLYVAGGETGSITVYDIATKAQVAKFETGSGGFLNDLQVTRHGDVYVTDSFRPTLWHVTARAGRGRLRHAAGRSTSARSRTGAAARSTSTASSPRARASSSWSTRNSGKLFRIKLGEDGDSIDSIDEITGATVPGGDGMLLDNGRLVVVQGNPAQLSFLKLRKDARRAKLERTQTSDKLRGPSTVDRAKSSTSS